MPIVTNHRGPSFREYSRTPAEKRIVELEERVLKMEEQLAQQLAEQSQPPAKSENEESTNQ